MASFTPIRSFILGGVMGCALLGCARGGEPGTDSTVATLQRSVVGQLMLPRGRGTRGIEVCVVIAAPGNEARKVWVLLDQQGNFAHAFQGVFSDN